MRKNSISFCLIFSLLFLFVYVQQTMGQPQKQSEGPPRVSMVERYPDAKKISVDFFKIDLHNVFRLLGNVSGKNIVVDEDVRGNLTLSLQEVPWPLVLDVIAGLKNLDIIERDNTIMIFPLNKKVAWETLAPQLGVSSEEILKLEEITPGPVIEETVKVPEGPALTMEQIMARQTSIEEVNKAQRIIKDAELLTKKGDIKNALKLYMKASEIWPENISLSKKIVSIALGRVNEPLTALNYAKKVLSFQPDDPEASTHAAIALASMGKKDEAKIYFEKSVDREKPPLDSLLNYAVFSESIGDYRTTLRLVNTIEKKYDLSPEAMLLKARALERMGKREAARKEYHAVLQSGASIPPDMLAYAKNRMELLQGTH